MLPRLQRNVMVKERAPGNWVAGVRLPPENCGALGSPGKARLAYNRSTRWDSFKPTHVPALMASLSPVTAHGCWWSRVVMREPDPR